MRYARHMATKRRGFDLTPGLQFGASTFITEVSVSEDGQTVRYKISDDPETEYVTPADAPFVWPARPDGTRRKWYMSAEPPVAEEVFPLDTFGPIDGFDAPEDLSDEEELYALNGADFVDRLLRVIDVRDRWDGSRIIMFRQIDERAGAFRAVYLPGEAVVVPFDRPIYQASEPLPPGAQRRRSGRYKPVQPKTSGEYRLMDDGPTVRFAILRNGIGRYPMSVQPYSHDPEPGSVIKPPDNSFLWTHWELVEGERHPR